jgi:N-methylhydantoinase A
MRLGIDVGGTFTDLVLVDDAQEKVHYTKTLTTPHDLSEGVMTGLDKILGIAKASMADVDYVVHGTTIGTNALLERKGARTGLITTEGFVDVLEIGRFQRPKEGLYDFTVANPEPLVPRHLRKAVGERVDSGGKVQRDLDEDEVLEVLRYFKDEGIESLAVCLLFSFLNPDHERTVGRLAGDVLPDCYVSLSSEVAPEFREYERTSTTVINAYLQPILDQYLARLGHRLNERHGDVDLRVMQVGGGMMRAEVARRWAVQVVNSGPAGGAVSGSYVARATGNPDSISVDMGGTSFDICMIEDGRPRTSVEAEFEGFPVKIPVVDINGIGAGGGSIAWLDAGGVLNVGPRSAGSHPGPACYGLGGDVPTVTDANLVLSRLNPASFLGGEMKLDVERAKEAVGGLGREMGVSVEEAADGIIRVVNANMAKGISVSSTEKGYDVREFALVAFGGAGPLHAVQLARELGIPRVLVPPAPGTFSALGLLVADTRHDYVQSFPRPADSVDSRELLGVFRKLEAEGAAELEEERVRPEAVRISRSVDMRYRGQAYELNVPVDGRDSLDREDVENLVAEFTRRHRDLYQYISEEEDVEFVNVRVRAVGLSPPMKLPKLEAGPPDPSKALKERREVHFEGVGFAKVDIYDRARLLAGNLLRGPCIVEEPMSTTVLIGGSSAEVDEAGNILITMEGG